MRILSNYRFVMGEMCFCAPIEFVPSIKMKITALMIALKNPHKDLAA